MNPGVFGSGGAATGGGVRLVQSGVALGAGTIAITRVDPTKSFVLSVSKGSAGTVAARGDITLTPSGGNAVGTSAGTPYVTAMPTYSGSLTGGTTDLTTKQYSARLTSSTQITVDGPCEWQVISYF